MSCDNYCPEVHNASDSEDTEDSDFNVESMSSEESKEDCGQCWDCEKNKDCPAKISEATLSVKRKLEDKVQKMIKKEVDEKFKVPDRMDHPAFKDIRTAEFDKLTDEEKIVKVAIAFHKTGGIDISNILELKMLMVLIGATENMEGFKEFPRNEVYRLMDMIIYHANKHMESLDI